MCELKARHDRGTAWARYAMCESALRNPSCMIAVYRRNLETSVSITWSRKVTVWANIIAELTRNYKLEVCALLGYYAASSGNFLRTFRYNLSVPYSGFKNPRKKLFRNVCKKLYRYSLRNNPEERRSHLLRSGSLKSRKGTPVRCPRQKGLKGE